MTIQTIALTTKTTTAESRMGSQRAVSGTTAVLLGKGGWVSAAGEIRGGRGPRGLDPGDPRQ